MHLHEFMNDYREKILAECYAELLKDEPSAETLESVREFYDEILRAMRRDSGVPESYSPLPQHSETAARLGSAQHRAGVPPAKVLAVFGAISQSVGRVGELYELTIAADEYALLNRCLDTGVATSIENYWRRDRSQATARTTELYGHFAHELRNALGNAKMAWKLVRLGKLDVHGRTADVVDRNLLRMGMLVAQCLRHTQLDAGGPPALLPTHLASVLRDIEASTVPDRGIRLVLEVDEGLFVAADELLLSSAVSNLVHNAVKFSKEGGVVTLSAHAEDGVALIRVDDECGGVGKASLEQLCQPFVSRRASKEQGIGLGLAITKSAIETMQGQLNLVDRPGRGCTFMLALPLVPT